MCPGCRTNQCHNDGTCRLITATGKEVCNCRSGYSGADCSFGELHRVTLFPSLNYKYIQKHNAHIRWKIMVQWIHIYQWLHSLRHQFLKDIIYVPFCAFVLHACSYTCMCVKRLLLMAAGGDMSRLPQLLEPWCFFSTCSDWFQREEKEIRRHRDSHLHSQTVWLHLCCWHTCVILSLCVCVCVCVCVQSRRPSAITTGERVTEGWRTPRCLEPGVCRGTRTCCSTSCTWARWSRRSSGASGNTPTAGVCVCVCACTCWDNHWMKDSSNYGFETIITRFPHSFVVKSISKLAHPLPPPLVVTNCFQGLSVRSVCQHVSPTCTSPQTSPERTSSHETTTSRSPCMIQKRKEHFSSPEHSLLFPFSLLSLVAVAMTTRQPFGINRKQEAICPKTPKYQRDANLEQLTGSQTDFLLV